MIIDKALSINYNDFYLDNLNDNIIFDNYLSWLKNEEVNKYLEIRHNIPDIEKLKKFVNDNNNSNDNLLLGIFTNKKAHIGNIKLGPINKIYKRSTIGLFIGDRSYWGKGIATYSIKAITDYAFKSLKLFRVDAGCYNDNIGSYKAFIKAGYKEEARLKNYWSIDNIYQDEIILTIFNNEN
tara:strand:- start:122 stop:664 length:543 start_codon:yes stop_codon:yes gene_type:complete